MLFPFAHIVKPNFQKSISILLGVHLGLDVDLSSSARNAARYSAPGPSGTRSLPARSQIDPTLMRQLTGGARAVSDAEFGADCGRLRLTDRVVQCLANLRGSLSKSQFGGALQCDQKCASYEGRRGGARRASRPSRERDCPATH